MRFKEVKIKNKFIVELDQWFYEDCEEWQDSSVTEFKDTDKNREIIEKLLEIDKDVEADLEEQLKYLKKHLDVADNIENFGDIHITYYDKDGKQYEVLND